MGHRPCILLCEHDSSLNARLVMTLEQAGFWVDAVHTTQQAMQKLGARRYQALVLNLLLHSQDALSFSHELRVLGLRLPILVLSSVSGTRRTANASVASRPSNHPEPDWIRKAADQARAIFAVKSACQRSRGFRPRILHMEADAFSAGLVNAALRGCAELVQVGDIHTLDGALDQPEFDFILFNADASEVASEDALHRIASMCPDTPVTIQTHYENADESDDVAFAEGDGVYVVNALRTLMLHAMQVPLRAQA